MEKCDPSTLARTLRRGRRWAKIALISSLFIPGLLASERIFLQVKTDDVLKATKVGSQPRQKNLVKIYSIVKSNRPDMEEPQAWKISNAILKESVRYSLDPILVLALIDVESKFQHAAVSPAGARGLMQILPGTGKALVQEIGLTPDSNPDGFRPEFLDDPIMNIRLGIYYLQDLKKNFRSLTQALIAYNLGPTELKNRMDNNLGYSGEYATSVLDAYQKYQKTKLPTF